MSTHSDWIAKCAERLIFARSNKSPDLWKYYSNLAHQIAQARPKELREFVEQSPPSNAVYFPSLMVLAWRIVGNECRDEMASRACNAKMMLCDIDESEKATENFRTQD